MVTHSQRDATLGLHAERRADGKRTPDLAVAPGLALGVAIGFWAVAARDGSAIGYRGEHQIGLSVDAYGPGLLVLHAKPPAKRPPHGGGMAILTT
jgi:hypothetical protein